MSEPVRTVQMAGRNLVRNHAKRLGFHRKLLKQQDKVEPKLAESAKLSQANRSVEPSPRDPPR